jgi:hypothetical protein
MRLTSHSRDPKTGSTEVRYTADGGALGVGAGSTISGGRGPRALSRHRRARRPHRPALPAPARRPVVRPRGASAAIITAGSWTKPAAASSSPMMTWSIPRARQGALRDQSLSRAGMRGAPVRLYGIWDRSPCPSCRCGSRSPGRTDFATSCSRTFPATGFSARRTPAIPCTRGRGKGEPS